MFYKVLIVAKNTFTETLRQPVYSVIITLALLLFLMSPSITMYTMDEDVKLLRELGLSTLFLMGLFIAIFSAGEAVTEEIETKTITTVLSKPIGRSTFIIGKFFGVALAVIVAHFICTIAMLMAIRHGVLETVNDTHDWPVITAAALCVTLTLVLTAFLNYSYDWNFPSAAIRLGAFFTTLALIFLAFIDKEWKFNPSNNNFTTFDIYASLLLLLAVLILVAVAIMFSTRFNIVLTLIFCLSTFLVGLISDWAFGRYTETHLLAKIAQVIVPNFQVFWISDAIYEKAEVPLSYLAMGSAYSVLYIAGILCLAVSLFQKRQVG